MPRIARRLIDNGCYHVITRGLDRRRLFRYKPDYQLFLDIVASYLKLYQLRILHYCLMPNHLHLLVKTVIAADMPKFMQVVLQVYAANFRKKYKSTGFVFQNRYKSRLIDSEAYLLECARYIERNPLRARIVQDIQDYHWSSYLHYAKGIKDKLITLDNPLYLDLSPMELERRNAYSRFISQQRPYDPIVDKEFRIA